MGMHVRTRVSAVHAAPPCVLRRSPCQEAQARGLADPAGLGAAQRRGGSLVQGLQGCGRSCWLLVCLGSSLPPQLLLHRAHRRRLAARSDTHRQREEEHNEENGQHRITGVGRAVWGACVMTGLRQWQEGQCDFIGQARQGLGSSLTCREPSCWGGGGGRGAACGGRRHQPPLPALLPPPRAAAPWPARTVQAGIMSH
jgi:hypothetical protein